jgi:hypothetical protein
VSSPLLGGLGFLSLLWRATVNSDGGKASFGNAQRPRPGVIVTAPRRQRRGGQRLLRSGHHAAACLCWTPLRLGARTTAPSSRCEAADRSTSWVSVSFIGILRSVGDCVRAVTTEAPQWALSRRSRIPGTPRVLLRNTNSHALFAAEIRSLARENMALSAVSAVRGQRLLVATRSSSSKGALQNDICWFESCMRSQPCGLSYAIPGCHFQKIKIEHYSYCAQNSGSHMSYKTSSASLKLPIKLGFTEVSFLLVGSTGAVGRHI